MEMYIIVPTNEVNEEMVETSPIKVLSHDKSLTVLSYRSEDKPSCFNAYDSLDKETWYNKYYNEEEEFWNGIPIHLE
jgi:hypothetical protein